MYLKTKECVAILLAGGQGSRLKVLTEETAKPAVPFGGKYRIIDFPLSNCVNSGIDTVGILTQYQPLELNEYIGTGSPWGLNRNVGGAHILPPYSKSKKSEWYKGTANAVFQNLTFINRYNPDYVLILSGDHIYKMDYSLMLNFHKEKNAECTIAVLEVPMEEASRFGILSSNPDGSIYEFSEKPKKPKSNKASMGIYIFNRKLLSNYLTEDDEDETSSHDFGKDIIPKLLKDKKRLFSYDFKGYWKDVGTLESLHQANMDLLDDKSGLNLKDSKFKIYARNYAKPSSYIGSFAEIENSYIAEGCSIKGCVKNSIVSTGCCVEEGALVEDSVIMPNSYIGKSSKVTSAILGENVFLEKNVRVGDRSEFYSKEDWGISVIGKGNTIKQNSVIQPKEII